MKITSEKIKKLIIKDSSIARNLCLIIIFLGVIIYGILCFIIPKEIINSVNGKSIILSLIYSILSIIAIIINLKRTSKVKNFAEKNFDKVIYSKGICNDVIMEMYGKEPFVRYKYFVKFQDEDRFKHKSEILEKEKYEFEKLINKPINIAIIPKYKEGYFCYAFLEKKEP